jgi:hypothetical protein
VFFARALKGRWNGLGGLMLALRSGVSLAVSLVASGCNTVIWGNLGVLCVTVAIFLGTVFLSRATRGNQGSSNRSSASTSHNG